MSIELLLNTCKSGLSELQTDVCLLFNQFKIYLFIRTYHFHIIKHYAVTEKSLIKSKKKRNPHSPYKIQ